MSRMDGFGGWPNEQKPPQGAANVVELWRSHVTSRSRITSDVLEYWEALREDSPIPRRIDVDPLRLSSALPYVFLLERPIPSIARFRIAGSHLSDLMGRDATGCPITCFCAPGTRSQMLPYIDAVFDTPAVVSMDLVAHRAGQQSKAAELQMLPLRDREGKVTRALGSLVARGPIEFTPYRFVIEDARQTPLDMPKVERHHPPKPIANTEHVHRDWRPTSVPWLKIVD